MKTLLNRLNEAPKDTIRHLIDNGLTSQQIAAITGKGNDEVITDILFMFKRLMEFNGDSYANRFTSDVVQLSGWETVSLLMTYDLEVIDVLSNGKCTKQYILDSL